jgi:hypothetical protein
MALLELHTESSVLNKPQTMLLGFVYIGSMHYENNYFCGKFSPEVNYAFAHQGGKKAHSVGNQEGQCKGEGTIGAV